MQTFLPQPTFSASHAALDWRRLQNQVFRECRTLIRGGWPNHPASRMWREYRSALALYALTGVQEMYRRNQRAAQAGEPPRWRREPLERALGDFMKVLQSDRLVMPPWLGNPELHASHRSQLLAKDPSHYGALGWQEEPGAIPYIWPA